jgi:tetratricopeptide (TPR) repeat protein
MTRSIFVSTTMGRPVRLLGAVAAAVGLAAAIAFGMQWWGEWPLRSAERELAGGNARRAVALAEYYLERHTDDGVALALKARGLVDLGEARTAAEIYEQIGAASAADIHAWAKAYLLQESWSRGVQLLKQYVRMRPDDADGLYELATSQARLGLFTDALDAARRYAAQPGEESQGVLLAAILHHDMKDREAAEAAFARVLELVPDATGLQLPPAEVFLQYGTILLDRGAAAAALPWLEKSRGARPGGEVLYCLGRARSQLAEGALAVGNTAEAAEWLGPLEAVATERPETAFLLQRLAAARKDTAAFDRWKPIADELRRRQQRVRALEQLIAGAPSSPWAVALRSHRFAAGGNWREAEDLLEGVPSSFDDEPFVAELREAVRTHGALPSLDGVPVEIK